MQKRRTKQIFLPELEPEMLIGNAFVTMKWTKRHLRYHFLQQTSRWLYGRPNRRQPIIDSFRTKIASLSSGQANCYVLLSTFSFTELRIFGFEISRRKMKSSCNSFAVWWNTYSPVHSPWRVLYPWLFWFLLEWCTHTHCHYFAIHYLQWIVRFALFSRSSNVFNSISLFCESTHKIVARLYLAASSKAMNQLRRWILSQSLSFAALCIRCAAATLCTYRYSTCVYAGLTFSACYVTFWRRAEFLPACVTYTSVYMCDVRAYRRNAERKRIYWCLRVTKTDWKRTNNNNTCAIPKGMYGYVRHGTHMYVCLCMPCA